MAQGTVKRFMADKGYGFIAPDDGTPDVFFHQSAIEADGYRGLQDNQRVEYTVTSGPRARGPIRYDPGFAEASGGIFISVTDLPGRTARNIVTFMGKLRGMHALDPLAFEVCLRHVASVIEDQRRNEGHTDPRDAAAR